MSLHFGNKGAASIFFGNKAVAAIYRGATLVWQKIKKILQFESDDKYVCIEYTPTSNVTVSDVSVFHATGAVNGCLAILNDSGLCVAYKQGNGSSTTEIYSATGSLLTSSSLNSPVLLAGRKYYICYIAVLHQTAGKPAFYQGLSGNYKIHNTNDYSQPYTTYNLNTVPSIGDVNTFSEISTKVLQNSIFTWRGPSMDNSCLPSDNGAENPYPFYCPRDVSNLKFVLTDSDFGQYSGNDADAYRYAYIYYKIGQNPGREFIMNTNYWGSSGQGFVCGSTRVFADSNGKIYKASGNISKNFITSMTPITQEPTNVDVFSIYFKAATQASDGWEDKNGNPITSTAVVVREGEWADESHTEWKSWWNYATGWTAEFEADPTYNKSNYLVKIDVYQAKDFNKVTVSTDKKYYLRVNGNEV